MSPAGIGRQGLPILSISESAHELKLYIKLVDIKVIMNAIKIS